MHPWGGTVLTYWEVGGVSSDYTPFPRPRPSSSSSLPSPPPSSPPPSSPYLRLPLPLPSYADNMGVFRYHITVIMLLSHDDVLAWYRRVPLRLWIWNSATPRGGGGGEVGGVIQAQGVGGVPSCPTTSVLSRSSLTPNVQWHRYLGHKWVQT